jgi:hypothetical protein
VSSTYADLHIWSTGASSQLTGPLPTRELKMPWAPEGLAFADRRALVYVLPPLGVRQGAELQPLQVPDGLEFTPVPLSIGQIVNVHAQGTAVAVEGATTMQWLLLAPARFWADRVSGGDLPDQVEDMGVGAAALLPGGEIELSLAGGLASEGTAWRRRAATESAWQPATPSSSNVSTDRPELPDEIGPDCRVRTSSRYAVMICPEWVRLYRRGGIRERWTLHANLLCAVPATGCRPPEHPVRIRDVRLDESEDRLVALHVAGRRYFTVTYPLSTKGLRDAVATIDDVLDR